MLKRLSVVVDTALHKRLRIHAATADESMNTVVVNAIEEYLQRFSNGGYEKDGRE